MIVLKMTFWIQIYMSKEVTEAIHHLKANKAAGPDGIIPEVYKNAGD